MGGFGSGKWANVVARKMSVQLCKEISVKLLKRNGFLDASKAGVIEWKNAAMQSAGDCACPCS